MLGCIEQEVCNIFYMHLNQKVKFNDWHTKVDPQMWMAADLECFIVALESTNENDSMEKLCVNKPVAIAKNAIKSSVCGKLHLEKMVISYTLVKVVLNG